MRKSRSLFLLSLCFAVGGLACGQSAGPSSGAAKAGASGASSLSAGGTSSAAGGRQQGGSGGNNGLSSTGGSGGERSSSTGLAGAGGSGGKSSGGSTGGSSNGGGAGAGGTGSGGNRAGSTAGGAGGSGGTTSGSEAKDAGTPDLPGEAGVADYQPCPSDGSACKILPYGDSITQGFPFAAQGGYRAPLFHLALADKKKITFIGALQDGPPQVDGVTFPKNHEGHFAMSIDWLTNANNVPDRLIQPAHIVLLHAGTNDRSGKPEDAAKKLEKLIDRILTVAPNAMLYVATIILCNDLGPEDNFVRAYDPLIPPIVEKRAKEGKHIKLVDQYTSFDPKTMFSPPEKYHPNLVGYTHMADVWYAAIKSVLP